jgi:hypothetical protein
LRIAVSRGDGGLAQQAKDAFTSATSVAATVGVVGGVLAAIVAVSVLRPKPAAPAIAPSTEALTDEPVAS